MVYLEETRLYTLSSKEFTNNGARCYTSKCAIKNNMKSRALKKHLINKGIIINNKESKTFFEYDYYQLVNAYKYIFVSKIETIDDIEQNILQGDPNKLKDYSTYYGIKNYQKFTNQLLFEKIEEKILSKYGIELSYVGVQNYKKTIKELKYQRHVLLPNTSYRDFVRMYEFEHDLRSVLMKYTLKIENRIKKIFIDVLNDEGVEPNYLVNIQNYNLSGSEDRRHDVIESLGMVVNMHKNNCKYYPIKHKLDQKLCVPYWIIINEMTMTQTIKTIKNLKENTSAKIKQKLINSMTNLNIDIFDSAKSQQAIETEKNNIKYFLDLLNSLSDFRNCLAHNRPIYFYNVKSHYPSIQYEWPSLKNNRISANNNFFARGINNSQQQQNLVSQLFNQLSSFFGRDSYNTRLSNLNVDLSYIIYCINKIVNVFLKGNTLGNEIRYIFNKYAIFTNNFAIDLYNQSGMISLLTNIEKINLNLIVEALKKNVKIRSEIRALKRNIQNIKNQSIKIKNKKSLVNYQLLPANISIKYTKYTNIDLNFLTNLVS